MLTGSDLPGVMPESPQPSFSPLSSFIFAEQKLINITEQSDSTKEEKDFDTLESRFFGGHRGRIVVRNSGSDEKPHKATHHKEI